MVSYPADPGRRRPPAAQVRSGQAAAHASSRSACAAQARTRTWTSSSSAAPIATAVCQPSCGSTPIITAATSHSFSRRHLGEGPQRACLISDAPGVRGEVDLRARCRCCHARFPQVPSRTRRTPLSAPGAPRAFPAGQPLAAAAGSVHRGRGAAAAEAAACHAAAGCAREDDPVEGEPPPLVAEATAELSHPGPVPALA